MTVHEHHFRRTAAGLRCIECGLYVPQPAGMPDYTRAVMARWALRSRP